MDERLQMAGLTPALYGSTAHAVLGPMGWLLEWLVARRRRTVIVFERTGGGMTTHRITAVNPDRTLQTKGDANRDADSDPVALDAVRGTGRLLIPRIGLPTVWLHQGPVAAPGGPGVGRPPAHGGRSPRG